VTSSQSLDERRSKKSYIFPPARVSRKSLSSNLQFPMNGRWVVLLFIRACPTCDVRGRKGNMYVRTQCL
jgi:hypothetical protein